ncbi:hypothetical protein D3H55_16275, partial [Bacillus salacetis]
MLKELSMHYRDKALPLFAVQLRLLAPRVASQKRKEAQVQASSLFCSSACRARTVGSAFRWPAAAPRGSIASQKIEEAQVQASS